MLQRAVNHGKSMISTKEIVEKYGIPYSTVNHYTVIGLLTIEGRKGNRRVYGEAEVRERLVRIRELQDQGYPLHLIEKELNKSQGAMDGTL